MLTIVQRGGATREKPPEVVRGQASRLPWVWDGLCFGVPFNDPTRDSARDLVVNAAPSSDANLAWTRDNRGNAAASLGTTSWINYPDNPAHNKPVTAITCYVRLRRLGAPDASGGVFCKRYDVADPFQSWGIYAATDPTAMAAQLTVNGTYYYMENATSLNTTDWYGVFLRWISGTPPQLAVLGERGNILSSIGYISNITGSISYVTGQPIRLNASEVDTQNNNAAYSQAMLWSRRLSDTELQALVADPYGWYSPRRETLGLGSPYPLAFGAGEMKFGTGSGGPR